MGKIIENKQLFIRRTGLIMYDIFAVLIASLMGIIFGGDGRRAPGAAGVAAPAAVGAGQTVQNQGQLGVRLDLKDLGGHGQDQAEAAPQHAQREQRVKNVHSSSPPLTRESAVRRSP